MKTILTIIDGGEEYVGSASIYDLADMPMLETIKTVGQRGKISFCPDGFAPDSLVCILTMLGIEPADIPTSRAWLETMAMGVNPIHQYIMRCNLVSVEENRLASFNAKGFNRQEMQEYARKVSKIAPPEIEFFHLSDYRNLIAIDEKLMGSETLLPPAPHENIGQDLQVLFAGLAGDHPLVEFMLESQAMAGGYMIYPWGGGPKGDLPALDTILGRRCGCVCKTELMAGMAKAMQMETVVPENATADFDTDLPSKLKAAKSLLDSCELVILHINGADELAHRQDYEGKLDFLRRIDEEVLSKLALDLHEDIRLIVTSDHITSSKTGKHEHGAVNWFCVDYEHTKQAFRNPNLQAGENQSAKFIDRMLCKDQKVRQRAECSPLEKIL